MSHASQRPNLVGEVDHADPRDDRIEALRLEALELLTVTDLGLDLREPLGLGICLGELQDRRKQISRQNTTLGSGASRCLQSLIPSARRHVQHSGSAGHPSEIEHAFGGRSQPGRE